MKKKWTVSFLLLFILLLFLLNLLGIYPKEVEMLPGDMEAQKITMEVNWHESSTC